MLPSHRRAPRRLLAGSAIAVSLAAASLLAGAPVHAQEKAQPKQERHSIIIMERGEGEPPAAGATERRELRIRRNSDGTTTTEGLDPETASRITGCLDGNQALNVNEEASGQRTRVVVCTRGEGGGANAVEALQRTRERIAADSEMSAESKQRVLAEIDRAIARARAGN